MNKLLNQLIVMGIPQLFLSSLRGFFAGHKKLSKSGTKCAGRS